MIPNEAASNLVRYYSAFGMTPKQADEKFVNPLNRLLWMGRHLRSDGMIRARLRLRLAAR